MIQGLLITRLNLQPFIVTLGFMLLLRSISQTIVKGGNLGFGPESPFRDIINRGWFMRDGDPMLPYPVLISSSLRSWCVRAAFHGVRQICLRDWRQSRCRRIFGHQRESIETMTYVISAGLAGVAGVCYAAYIGQMSQQVGIAYEFYAIAGSVLGGCGLRGGEGTVLGVIIGCRRLCA